jgi:surfeit locus 1 family protein
VTSNQASSPAGETTWRRVLVAVVAVAGVAITFNLGQWQLSRAQEKLSLQAGIDAQALQPPYTNADFQRDPSQWGQVFRPVMLEGQWLPQQTIFWTTAITMAKAVFG